MIDYSEYKYSLSESIKYIKRKELRSSITLNQNSSYYKHRHNIFLKKYPYETPYILIKPNSTESDLINNRLKKYIKDNIFIIDGIMPDDELWYEDDDEYDEDD